MVMSFERPLNLDANASWGTLPEVGAALAGEEWLNPSSIHSGGQRARAAVERARDSIRALLGLSRGRIIFTSGATEANNLALMLPFWPALRSGNRSAHLVATALEHHAVLEPAARLRALGFPVTIVQPDSSGSISAAGIAGVVTSETRLVSMMMANNESGQLLPVAEAATMLRDRRSGTLIHSDGVQAVGRLPLHFDELGIDLLSISAHKMGGLPGVGALVVSDRVEPEPLVAGGPQEMRWRAGTENVPGIVSFGIAAEVARRQLRDRALRCGAARDRFVTELREAVPGLKVIAEGQPRLPNTACFLIPGVRADDLVVALDLEGILISSGAACASGKPEPSHVLLALGLSEAEARSSVRISVTDMISPEIATEAALIVARCVQTMRRSG